MARRRAGQDDDSEEEELQELPSDADEEYVILSILTFCFRPLAAIHYRSCSSGSRLDFLVPLLW